MKRVIRSLSLIVLFTVLLSGCTDLDNPEVRSMNEDGPDEKNMAYSLLGPGPANYGAIRERRQPHHNDQEVNNTGLSYRDPVSARQSIGGEQEMLADVISSMDGVEPGVIQFMGGRATVDLIPQDRNLSQEEQDRLVRQVREKLKQANPRYDYRVYIED
jgi:hypothetical protein